MSITKYFFSFVLGVVFCFAQNSTNEDFVLKDTDGNIYKTVKIGDQIWTIENLKTTKFNDGTPILFAGKKVKRKHRRSPSYCWNDNDINNKDKYGALYNWYAVNTGKLAPKGWHVPTDDDWIKLERYLIENGYNWDGTKEEDKIAKSLAAKSGWTLAKYEGRVGNNMQLNNKSGFSAVPSGWRNPKGKFGGIGKDAEWWCSVESYGKGSLSMKIGSGPWRKTNNEAMAYSYSISYCSNVLFRSRFTSKSCWYSVRLIRD